MDRVLLDGKFEHVEDFNSSFLRTKIKVFAFGKNRNNSNISESAFEIAKSSIYNIPIVAKFTEDADKYGNEGDLEGHNVYLDTDKNGDLTIKMDTYAIGVVSSDANITFEDVNEGNEDNPDIKTYVVIDNVYLWKRYDAVAKIQEWLNGDIQPKVSMEIGKVIGSYSKDNGCYMIDSFEFEAIAALGSTVEPCFPMAQIESYSKQTFEESFYQMIKELKFSLSNQSQQPEIDIKDVPEGGMQVELQELLQKYSITVKQLTDKQINYEDYSLEDLETKIQEVFTQVDEKEAPVSSEFTLTSNQLSEELRRELSIIETLTEVYWDEVYTYPRYYYRDCKSEENIVIAMDEKNWYLVGFNYSVNGDKVSVDASSLKRFKVNYEPMELDAQTENVFTALIGTAKSEFMLEAKEKTLRKEFEAEKESSVSEINAALEKVKLEYGDLFEQFNQLKEQADAMQNQLNQIAQEDRQVAEDALFEQFSDKLSEEEMANIKALKSQMSLEDIEKELKLAFADKALSKFSAFSKDKDRDKPLRFSIPDDNKAKNDKPYAELIEKHSK